MKFWLSKQDLKTKQKAEDKHFSYEKLIDGFLLIRNNRNAERGTYTIRHYREDKMTIRAWRA